jgi:hypothetical protein
MTGKKRFGKLRAASLCLLLLTLSAPRVVDGQGSQLPPQNKDIPEGYVIIEGDIQVPVSHYQALVKGAWRSEAATFPRDVSLWPNGIVPFEFDNNCGPASTTCVSAENQTAMLNAMAILQGVANVNFQQCPANTCSGDYVHIQASTGNNSPVGKRGGQQVINIISWGDQFRVVHELLHCLGFYHEQSSPQRDNYVTINCGNIQGDAGDCQSSMATTNFTIRDDALFYGPYDFDSLMHYDQCAFSKDCPTGSTCRCTNTTITVKAPYNAKWQSAIGKMSHLSDLDKLTVSFFYPQPNWRFVDQSYTGWNGDSDGSFRRPYQDLATAVANTPAGGTLWIQPGVYDAVGAYNAPITLKAPIGNVSLQ